MPSITGWMRLEPRTRNQDIESGLEARLYDPLWLLGRQFQLGEFTGEFGGSLIAAQLLGSSSPLTRYHPGALSNPVSQQQIRERAYQLYVDRGRGSDHALDDWLKAERELLGSSSNAELSEDYDLRRVPLETLVERERNARGAGALPRLAVEAGLHFLRLLDGTVPGYRQAFVDAYPFASPTGPSRTNLDADSLRFLDLMSGRVPDGATLYDSMVSSLAKSPPALPERPSIAVADQHKVIDVAASWRKWYEALLSDRQTDVPVWRSDRMEYQFAVSAHMPSGSDLTLEAEQYFGDGLDWHSLDHRPGITLGPAGNDVAQASSLNLSLVPTAVTFPGMPATRFWQFEDGQVNLAAVEAGPEDLARLVMLEFGLVYGNDWFVIPVPIPVGTACLVDTLVVTDTFGQTFPVPHYSRYDMQQGHGDAWRMFSLSQVADASSTGELGVSDAAYDANVAKTFLLPPILGPSVRARPVEEVLLLRDEMASMAWAVERVVESPAGLAMNRFEVYQERLHAGSAQSAPSSSPAAGSPSLAYRLASVVPDYWNPLLPVPIAPNATTYRLRRGAMLAQDGSNQPLNPMGRILQPGGDLTLYDEEVSRVGVRLERGYRYARWSDSSTHLWVGRLKAPGRGEGSSGLRFDVAEQL